MSLSLRLINTSIDRQYKSKYLRIVFSGIGALLCIPTTVWLLHTGEGTLRKETLADEDKGTLGEDSQGKGTLALVDELGQSAFGEVPEADRLLPCMVLFLVSNHLPTFINDYYLKFKNTIRS